MVVDDVKEQRDIASQILTALGYSVKTFASGEETIEFLKEESADLIIIDMILEDGMDGLDTYKKILEIRPGQKAVIVSGFSESERVKEIQSLGAGAYLKKPYTIERIGFAVRNEIER